tara:strand:- start:135 stop:764 length:630 start_codon:yes stop_codon:yes gene_type:complete
MPRSHKSRKSIKPITAITAVTAMVASLGDPVSSAWLDSMPKNVREAFGYNYPPDDFPRIAANIPIPTDGTYKEYIPNKGQGVKSDKSMIALPGRSYTTTGVYQPPEPLVEIKPFPMMIHPDYQMKQLVNKGSGFLNPGSYTKNPHWMDKRSRSNVTAYQLKHGLQITKKQHSKGRGAQRTPQKSRAQAAEEQRSRKSRRQRQGKGKGKM